MPTKKSNTLSQHHKIRTLQQNKTPQKNTQVFKKLPPTNKQTKHKKKTKINKNLIKETKNKTKIIKEQNRVVKENR